MWLWFAFPWLLVMLTIFSCVYWPSVCLLFKNVCSGPITIFNHIVYVFDVELYVFCVFLVSIIFSHSAGSLFALLIAFFSMEKLINPNVATFVKFFFCCPCLRRHIKKLKRPMSKSVLFMFFLWVLWFQILTPPMKCLIKWGILQSIWRMQQTLIKFWD